VSTFIRAEQREERGAAASLRWLLPVLRVSVAAMWFIAAIVSVGPYPVADSLALLRSIGIPATFAPWALYGAIAIDLLFGLSTLWPRRARWLWNAQLAVVLVYTLIISIELPGLWLEPFGPVAKNLPILALLLALRELERRR
jgi:predicted neutral ceramidase superfamily lipid hydrolase